MTRDEAEALGRRALAAGFDAASTAVLCGACLYRACCLGCRVRKRYWPDFRDAATRGILLEQVREAYGNDRLTVFWVPEEQRGPLALDPWSCEKPDDDQTDPPGRWNPLGGGSTETEALIAAWEAKP